MEQAKLNEFTEQAFAKIDGLYDLIRSAVKMPSLRFEGKIVEGRYGNKRIEFESEDLSQGDFLISLAWKEFKIKDFNSQAGEDKETGKPFYWIFVNYNYQHIDGGSNGATIGNAYFLDNKWIFQLDKDNRK